MAADDEHQERGVTMSNTPEQGPVATLAGSEHNIVPSRTFAVLLWVGISVAVISVVSTIALATAGRPAAVTVTLVTIYAALTLAGRRWSQ